MLLYPHLSKVWRVCISDQNKVPSADAHVVQLEGGEVDCVLATLGGFHRVTGPLEHWPVSHSLLKISTSRHNVIGCKV